jgi:hypothetical protein
VTLFNRIFVTIVDALVLVAAAWALIGLIVPATARNGLTGPLSGRLIAEIRADTQAWALSLLLCLALIAAGTILMLMEWNLWPGEEGEVLIGDNEDGRVNVAVRGLEASVDYEARHVAGVKRATSSVSPNRDGLSVRTQLLVESESNVPELTEELRSKVESALQRMTGQPVKSLTLSVDVQPPANSTGRGKTRVV